MKGVWTTRLEWHQEKWQKRLHGYAELDKHIAMQTVHRVQKGGSILSRLEALAAEKNSCWLSFRPWKGGGNCIIEVSRIDWQICFYIYIGDDNMTWLMPHLSAWQQLNVNNHWNSLTGKPSDIKCIPIITSQSSRDRWNHQITKRQQL